MNFKKDFLSAGNTYTVVNHLFVKEFGLNAAFWLSEMIAWDSHLDSMKRDDPEWFHYKQPYMEEKTGLSRQIQNRACSKLIHRKVIERERRGAPSINWYRIRYDILQSYCFNTTTRIKKQPTVVLNQYDLHYNSNKKYTSLSPENVLSSICANNRSINRKFFHLAKYVQDYQVSCFPRRFKQYSPEQLAKQVEEGGRIIDQLERLDKFEFLTIIKPAIEWALKHDFWQNQIYSLTTFRQKGRNGETKFTNLYTQWVKDEGIDPGLGRFCKSSDYKTKEFG